MREALQEVLNSRQTTFKPLAQRKQPVEEHNPELNITYCTLWYSFRSIQLKTISVTVGVASLAPVALLNHGRSSTHMRIWGGKQSSCSPEVLLCLCTKCVPSLDPWQAQVKTTPLYTPILLSILQSPGHLLWLVQKFS